jgi:hypothetical protein
MDTEAIINWADESINAVNLLSGGMALFQIEENVLLGVSNWRQSANDLPSGGLGGYRHGLGHPLGLAPQGCEGLGL